MPKSNKNKSNKKENSHKIELEKYKEEAKKNFEGWQRALADYANLKKNYEEKERELRLMIEEHFFREILPIFEMFSRAFDSVPEEIVDNNWVKGVRHIKKQFDELLTKFNIKKIDTIGKKFNPNEHEAIGEEESNEFDSGIIIKQVSEGYKIGDKVLIPARVIVAK